MEKGVTDQIKQLGREVDVVLDKILALKPSADHVLRINSVKGCLSTVLTAADVDINDTYKHLIVFIIAYCDRTVFGKGHTNERAELNKELQEILLRLIMIAIALTQDELKPSIANFVINNMDFVVG